MTNEEALKVLEGMGIGTENDIADDIIELCTESNYDNTSNGYICVSWSDAHINATLSADQLEAIARWMRDPEGVAP